MVRSGPRAVVPVCRNPGATLLRIDNPGPAPAAVGRTVIYPGRGILCIPPGAQQLVAVEVTPAGPGQPPRPVMTPDRRAIVGHPIAIVARGPRSASGTIDTRYVVALPMAFAAAGRTEPGPPPAPQPWPPPGSAPDSGPPGSGPPGNTAPTAQPPADRRTASTDPPDDGTTDSLYQAWSATEAPVDGNGDQRGDAAFK